MKNSLNIIFVIMLVATITGLFHIKNQVKNLKKDLVEINRQIINSKKDIHILEAEWNYLNNPERIKKLSAKHLELEPIKISQFKEPYNIKSFYIAKHKKDNPDSVKYITPQLKPILSNY